MQMWLSNYKLACGSPGQEQLAGDQHGEQWQINVLNVQKDVENHGFFRSEHGHLIYFDGGKKPHRTW